MTEMGIEHIALAASGAMPTRIVDRSERAEVVQQAVMALGERQRVALILSRFENMSYQEIADTMGLTVKAVKSLLSRARVNLKTLLQPYMDDGSGLAFPGAANSAATDEQGMEDDDQVIAKGDSV
jgi:RNA polymerase sigma-70 factor (ECF subfamily)